MRDTLVNAFFLAYLLFYISWGVFHLVVNPEQDAISAPAMMSSSTVSHDGNPSPEPLKVAISLINDIAPAPARVEPTRPRGRVLRVKFPRHLASVSRPSSTRVPQTRCRSHLNCASGWSWATC